MSDSFDDWQFTYTRYAEFLCELKRLSFEYAGLSLNLEKSALLLPLGALPCDEVRSKFPVAFDFQQAGVRIAGSPVGTDAYMRTFVDEKIKEAHTAKSVPSKFSALNLHA